MENIEIKLTEAGIDQAAEIIESFLTKCGCARTDILKIRLTAEETLLRYMKVSEKAQSFQLRTGKVLFDPRVELLIEGDALDPFTENEEQEVLNRLLQFDRRKPSWNFRGEVNRVSFSAKKKAAVSPLTQIFLALFLGLGLGISATRLPNHTGKMIADMFISPISDTILGLLSACAIPMIFFSILNGFCGMEGISQFNRFGKKAIFYFLSFIFLYGIVITLISAPIFGISREGNSAIDSSALYKMVIEIIPKDLVSPFIEKNSLQIIFLSIFSSLVIMILGNRVSLITHLIPELCSFFSGMTEAVNRFMPLVVFCGMFSLATSGAIGVILSTLKPILLMILFTVVTLFFAFFRAAAANHISLKHFFHISGPLTLQLLASPVSSSSIQPLQKIGETELKLDSAVNSSIIPLCISFFKPCCAICYTIFPLYFAQLTNIPVTPSAAVILWFSACLISVATPPIAGAAISNLGLLLAQLGIPAEALAIYIAVDAIVDRISTPANVLITLAELKPFSDFCTRKENSD